MTVSRPPTVPKQWIDALKGIGIVAVVAGHAYSWRNGSLVPLIYLFHMPLFFFLSGYLYKPSPDLIAYFRKKFFHLLVPYAAFLLLLVIIPEFYSAIVSHQLGVAEAKLLVKNAVYGGRRLEGVGTVFWFVTCLFFTQQLFNLLVVRLHKQMLFPVVLVATALSFVNAWLYQDTRFPLNVNVVLAALPIFYAGYVFKRHEQTRWITPVALVISAVAVGSVLAGVPNYYDMKVIEYGIPAVTMVSALSITVALIAAAKQLERAPFALTGLVALGQASMIIMFVHRAILILWEDHGVASVGVGIVLATATPYLLYLIANRFAISRALLLGSESDFRKLVSIRRSRHEPDPLPHKS